MDRNRVTVRYARALFETAQEQQATDDVYNNIKLLFQALSQHYVFNEFVSNPGLLPNVKLKKVKAVFSQNFHPLTNRFLDLVFTSNRENYLKDICRNFIEMVKVSKGIISARLVTASDLDNELISAITSKFEQQTKATIEMEAAIDPDLIGGFVFTIDGWQYDASIASKLKAISKQLHLK
jgi:F-type H+-transporting ATPase subunit delta